MMCQKCHDTDGPFIADVQTGKCLCESCYMLEEVVDKMVKLIRYRASNKDNLNMTAVVTMDSVELLVFDELGIK